MRIGRSLMALALVVSLLVSSGLTAAGLAAEIPAGGRDAAEAAGTKIDSNLRTRLQSGRAPSLIILANQADTSFADALPTKAAKGRAVFDALTAQARRDQPALLAALKSRGISGRGFLSINAIGAASFVLSSDLGQPPNPLHTDGLLALYKGLMAHGVAAADIDVMARKNPARLLGLEP